MEKVAKLATDEESCGRCNFQTGRGCFVFKNAELIEDKFGEEEKKVEGQKKLKERCSEDGLGVEC